MSDPKTSQANTLSDRILISALISIVCFTVAFAWALVMPRESGIFPLLVSIAIPLIASGSLVVLAAFIPGLIPFDRVRFPLQLTFPILWVLIALVSVGLLSTKESSTTRIQPALEAILKWQNPVHFVPVMIAQIFALSMFALIQRGSK